MRSVQRRLPPCRNAHRFIRSRPDSSAVDGVLDDTAVRFDKPQAHSCCAAHLAMAHITHPQKVLHSLNDSWKECLASGFLAPRIDDLAKGLSHASADRFGGDY